MGLRGLAVMVGSSIMAFGVSLPGTAALAAPPTPAIQTPTSAAAGAPVDLAARKPRKMSAKAMPIATGGTSFGLNVWTLEDLNRAQDVIGAKAGIVGVFRDWVHDPDFPTAIATQIAAQGGIPLISWEPWDSWTGVEKQSAFTLKQINSGRYDALVDRWARQIKGYGGPVLIRFAPEMNGTWRPWSVGVSGNTAKAYITAWRRVVNRMRAQGAANIGWVWNPYVEVGGSSPMMATYPGSSYVDYTALDGYNWGSTRPWGWQSYDDIFASSVRLLKAKAPGKPWFIAEIGCAPGSGKPAWIAATMDQAQDEGAVAVVWFEFNKETDWRLSADADSALAARTELAGGGWLLGR